MKNYERYQNISTEEYDKKKLMYYLTRRCADKKILPYIKELKNNLILDAGIGTGYYAKYMLKDNKLTGVDINPHLCKLPVEMLAGDAAKLSDTVSGRKFDIVFSAWLTEYLDQEQLFNFFRDSHKILDSNGKLISTIITNGGIGLLYVTAAEKIRKIKKYCYSKKTILSKLQQAGFSNTRIIELPSYLKIPWAYMLIAEK